MAEAIGFMQHIIPGYELMRKYKIFTDEKISAIIKTRKNYEYKLCNTAKSVKDYAEYIIYEKKIYSMLVEVEDSRKEKFPELRQAMANRIARLYKEALRGFPEEDRLWEAYLKFCKINCPYEVGNAYEKLLQKQDIRPIIWVDAATWFHQQDKNVEKVKHIFFRGLQRHPDCATLYTAFIGIMLEDTANQPEEFQREGLERVLTIYNTAKKKICRVDFLINTINQCDHERFKDFSKPLQKAILDDMMHIFPREEKVWDLLARRELKGANMSEFLKSFSEPDSTTGNRKPKGKQQAPKSAPSVKRNIEVCFKVYQTATETLKTKNMWALFLNAMMELNTDLSTYKVLKREKLTLAFRAAHECDAMTSDTYYAYINLLIDTKAKRDLIYSILVHATSKFCTVKLWEQRLRFHILEDNQEEVYDTFCTATLQLGPKSYSIWRLTLYYYQTHYYDHYDRLAYIFKKACEQTGPKFKKFRCEYLEWKLVNESMKESRKAYLELIKLPPPYLEVHQKMALLESQAFKPDVSLHRECYENAIKDFGKVRTDVWIDYIKFELATGESKRVSILCERAKRTLDPLYVDNFVIELSFHQHLQ